MSGSNGDEWTVPGRGKGDEFAAQKCKVWVANRALSLGWTAKRFPVDKSLAGRRDDGARIERIGKKYQRIALMELLARLADNFWLKPQWGKGAAMYDNPLDIDFTRDLEPSVMLKDLESTIRPDVPNIPPLVCAPLPVERRREWVMHKNLAAERLALATCPDLSQPDWLSLYRYAGHNIDADREDRQSDAPWLQSDFHFLAAMLVTSDVREQLVRDAVAHAYDFHEWLPPHLTDGPYLGELSRRDTWCDDPWTTVEARGGDEDRAYRVIRPTTDFRWESHLDGSLPDGVSRHLPIPWVIRELSLTADTNDSGVYCDANGVPVVVTGSASGEARESHVLVRRDPFLALANKVGLEPIWTVIGERRATTLVKKRHSDVRARYNGLQWLQGDEEKQAFWSNND